MSYLDNVQTQTRERVSLPPGSYGTSKVPGLKILAYIEKASKLDKSGAMRHAFLVSATRPSRESAEQAKSVKTNGNNAAAIPFEEPDYEGTAFFSLTLDEYWLNHEAVALAFTEASRNKDGHIQKDYIGEAISEGLATPSTIDNAQTHFRQIATDKLINANTPAATLDEEVEKQYRKELKQISMKVGQFLDLQTWAGVSERSLQFDPVELVGVEFSGKIEHREFNGQTNSEVTAVWPKRK